MDYDATEPVLQTESITAKDTKDRDIPGEGISDAQATAQIERLLSSFSARCDNEMLRVKDEFMNSRPRIGRTTIGLAIVVLGITTSTGFLMISHGATASQMLMSALGEMFLFGLVLVSGIADLLWRDPTKLLLAKDDQLARIAGIQRQILALSDVRSQWESDVNWHREKSGEEREILAQISLELADSEAAALKAKEELSSLRSACEGAEANLASLREREDVAQQEVEKFETRVADSQATLENVSAAVALAEAKLCEITAKTAESEERNSQFQNKNGELESQNQKLTEKLESFISRIAQAKAESIALEDKVAETDLENARLAEAVGLSELRLQELQDAVITAEGELQSLIEQKSEQQRLADALSSGIVVGEQNYSKLRVRSEELAQQVVDLETNRDAILLESSDLETHQRELHGAIASLSNALTERENTATVIEKAFTATNQRLQDVTIELTNKQQEAESLREHIGFLNTTVDETTQKCGDESARREALRADTARAESDLQSTTAALAERQSQLDSAASELKNHRSEIERLEELRSNLSACLAQLEQEIFVIEPFHAEVQSLLAENAKRAISLEADVAAKTAELESITQSLVSANEKRDGVLQEWTTLRGEVQQIAQAASADFESKNQCIADLNLSIDRLTSERSEVSKLDESARAAESRLADAEAAYSRCEEMALKLSGEIGKYEEKITELRGQADALQHEKSLSQTEAESVVNQLAASRAEIAQFHEKKNEYKEQLESLRQQVLEAEAVGRQWEDFIAGLNAEKLSLESDTEERALNLSALDSDVLAYQEQIENLTKSKGLLDASIQEARGELELNQTELLRLQDEIAAQSERVSGMQQAAFTPVQEIEDESAEETLGRVEGLISALDSTEIVAQPLIPTNAANPATVQSANEQRLSEPSSPTGKDGDAWDNVLL